MSALRSNSGAGAITAAQREALSAAAQWYAQFEGGETNAVEQRAWQAWREASPVNKWAWSRMEALRARLREMPGPLSAATLRIAAGQRAEGAVLNRRAVLKGMVSAMAVSWLGYELVPWMNLRADYTADAGATRAATLADGTRIVLDVRSAVRVDFDAGQRRLHLLAGEVLVETGRDPSPTYRPFTVHTAQGSLRALGTRFAVRQQGEATRLGVLEHEVEITPRDSTSTTTRLRAGQQAWFTADSVGDVRSADERLIAWTEGRLAVSDWTLAEFVAELGRYRSGWLRCDPKIAELRISGAFPLRDTDAALRAVEHALPVVARYRTPYWVTLQPR
jgi:transmembrane sensor